MFHLEQLTPCPSLKSEGKFRQIQPLQGVVTRNIFYLYIYFYDHFFTKSRKGSLSDCAVAVCCHLQQNAKAIFLYFGCKIPISYQYLYLGFTFRLLFCLLTFQSAQGKKEGKTSCVYKLALFCLSIDFSVLRVQTT